MRSFLITISYHILYKSNIECKIWFWQFRSSSNLSRMRRIHLDIWKQPWEFQLLINLRKITKIDPWSILWCSFYNVCEHINYSYIWRSVHMRITGVAGMCSKTAVAPLDRIKILLQAQHKHYKNLGENFETSLWDTTTKYCQIYGHACSYDLTGVLAGLRQVVQSEGFHALYKGNFVQMVRVVPYAAGQFTAYEVYKKVRRKEYFSYRKPFKLIKETNTLYLRIRPILKYIGIGCRNEIDLVHNKNSSSENKFFHWTINYVSTSDARTLEYN